MNCIAKKKSGEPCGAVAVEGDPCAFHRHPSVRRSYTAARADSPPSAMQAGSGRKQLRAETSSHSEGGPRCSW